MATIDWILVIILNGACILYGLWISRGARSTADWFLAGRSLPFWMVGLSLYATAIDASDLVADSGGVYQLGMSYFVVGWVGTVAGWIVAANWIVLPMYRRGMYTNAEYLEARFGPATRIISAFVQVQYRTMVLGIIANTLFLTLAVVCGWGKGAWWGVVAIVAIAAIYTTWGGLKSVAITDALQSVVMMAGAVALFIVVWNEVGGFDGARQRLAAHDPAVVSSMLHIGSDRVELVGEGAAQFEQTTPAWLVCVAFVILGFAYSVVNHTQSMRLFGARSEWDLKMGAVVASALLIVAMFLNLSIGIFGRALFPDAAALPIDELSLKKADSIYPLLIRELLPVGLTGLVVAAVMAASFSTFDSISSTIAALLTRDVYARLLVKDREDSHYLLVSRLLTPVILFASFAYVPFLDGGMLRFYIELVGAFVVPLLTIYLMGVFTPVHRRSGTAGLLAGVAYGVLRMLSPKAADTPAVLCNGYLGYVVSILVTAGVMILLSQFFFGWQRSDDFPAEDTEGWLGRSREAVHQIDQARPPERLSRLPLVLGLAVIAIGMILSFVVFW